MTERDKSFLPVLEAAKALVDAEKIYQDHFDAEVQPHLPAPPQPALERTRELHMQVVSSIRDLVERARTYDAAIQSAVEQIYEEPSDEPATKAPVQYVLVRKDLPPDVQMVMVGHATAEAIRVAPIDRRCILRMLYVAHEAELREYASKLYLKNFHVALVEENAGEHAGHAMALGTEPSAERINALGKLFWHLKPVRLETGGPQ